MDGVIHEEDLSVWVENVRKNHAYTAYISRVIQKQCITKIFVSKNAAKRSEVKLLVRKTELNWLYDTSIFFALHKEFFHTL